MSEITNIDVGRVAMPPSSSGTGRGLTESSGSVEVERQPEDRVELSDMGRLLAAARDLPDIRMDRVIAVREEIQAGTYETPDKIAITVDGLLRDLAG